MLTCRWCEITISILHEPPPPPPSPAHPCHSDDTVITVDELNTCLNTVGAACSSVQYIEIAYGHTDYLDEICRQFGFHGFKEALGSDQCYSGSPTQYPSHCGQVCCLHHAACGACAVEGGAGFVEVLCA